MSSITDRRPPARIVLAGVLILAVAGCGYTVEPPAVEEQIRTQLGADSATCPQPLPGEVGRMVTCSATAGPDTVDVRATVTAVDGADVKFDVTGIVNRPIVEEQIRTTYTADRATCPSSLAAKVGAKITCSATRGAETSDIIVTVTAVDGGNARFDLKQVKSVPGQAVAVAVRDQLVAQGQQVQDVRCSPLPAAVAATVKCELDAPGGTFPVTVTATEVSEDGNVKFDIEVAATPS